MISSIVMKSHAVSSFKFAQSLAVWIRVGNDRFFEPIGCGVCVSVECGGVTCGFGRAL
ncbi:hypothetical protein [Bartonella grahamii]|uniref:hypothetical protein n=1 Tax=Bartonella grahamii TaxID=33045 RepID=UPI0002FEF8EE|nr:hypothetical protein [Bartonella grahamii]